MQERHLRRFPIQAAADLLQVRLDERQTQVFDAGLLAEPVVEGDRCREAEQFPLVVAPGFDGAGVAADVVVVHPVLGRDLLGSLVRPVLAAGGPQHDEVLAFDRLDAEDGEVGRLDQIAGGEEFLLDFVQLVIGHAHGREDRLAMLVAILADDDVAAAEILEIVGEGAERPTTGARAMIIEVEDQLCKVAKAFLEVLSKLQRAAERGDAVHEVEETTWSGLIETGREMIVAYIQKQEEGVPRPTVIEQEGKKLQRLPGRRLRPYISAFGPTPFWRNVYAERETQRQEVVPLDAKLGMPEGNTSYLLQKWSGTKCVKESYEESRATLLEILGFAPSVNCLEDIVARAAEHAEVYFDQQEAVDPTTEKEILVATSNVGRVIGGIRQMATKGELSKRKRAKVEQYLSYFAERREYMKYDEYLAAGYPIGSGVVEGACRHLVKDRMEQTGMRWRIAGAQAVLSLRAIYVNDDWEPFHADRIRAEQRKLYPYKRRFLAILNCAT